MNRCGRGTSPGNLLKIGELHLQSDGASAGTNAFAAVPDLVDDQLKRFLQGAELE